MMKKTGHDDNLISDYAGETLYVGKQTIVGRSRHEAVFLRE